MKVTTGLSSLASNQQLYAVTVVFNPRRFTRRYDHYKSFATHIRELGAVLVTVEVAFGDRPFVITDADNPFHLRLRMKQELWVKENAIRLGIEHLSRVVPSWQYVAWIDADIQFQRRDIFIETVHQLQHFDVVQMFSHAIDMGPQGQTVRTDTSFMYQYIKGGAVPPTSTRGTKVGDKYQFWHPGYAWAARRSFLNTVGILEVAILGAGDHHMALGLVGRAALSLPNGISPGYRAAVLNWERRAEVNIRRNVGYVPGMITHAWHGDKMHRQYIERWQVLITCQYDPALDLVYDVQGLVHLTDFQDERSVRLRDLIRAYFGQRNEDSDDMVNAVS
ncbi:hypothetical protein [Bradyrhizobium sp. th.b2]|uniref:hypothetical protein n=1 Tax=Bradyrhizobium sp. th-b2 TaxID=172088 RepID=UPI0012EC3A0D|nr:hypothetical protein [Bradyrhizobium sp. th.b2]